MLTAFIASLVVSLMLVALIRSLALRVGLIDVPNSRSSHSLPTPRGGGVAIVIVTLSAIAISFVFYNEDFAARMAWALGGIMVAAVGFIDDLRNLSARMRAGIHVLAAIILLFECDGVPSLPSPVGPIDLRWLAWVAGIAAIVWSINLFNFMDGIDGLAATQVVFVACSGAALLGVGWGVDGLKFLLCALAGSAVGFMCWNLPPAKIFMGDAGSGFVGFSLAAVAILSARTANTNLWTWMVLNSLFAADATTTLVVRMICGERVYVAHRSHVYQRLARRWNSHRKVVFLYLSINFFWCLPWAIATVKWPAEAPIFAAIAILSLVSIAVAAGGGRSNS